MGWDRAFAASATYAKPAQFETFRRQIDAGWIEQALAATGTATVRRRRLPVEEVVWVVLAMALVRDRPIEDVVSKLDLALPGGGSTIARSSVYPADEVIALYHERWELELGYDELKTEREPQARHPSGSPKRLYPRAVKIKRSNYDRKRPHVEAQKK